MTHSSTSLTSYLARASVQTPHGKPGDNRRWPRLKSSLNAYSFADLLSLHLKESHRGLSLFELCDYCADEGFEAVDLTGYFFPGYPGVPADSYVYQLKRHAFDHGLAISGTGIRNDFTAADNAVRREGVQRAKAWIEVAAKLGAPVLRVFVDSQPPFSNWKDAAGGRDRATVEKWIVDAVRECADHGEKYGVIVGIQNHGDFVTSGAEHLRLLDLVDHKWCGAIVDTGKYLTADPYADIALVAPRAVNWQVKQNLYGEPDKPRTDMTRLIEIIRNSGYRGYVPIETLAMGRRDYDPFCEAAALHRDFCQVLAGKA